MCCDCGHAYIMRAEMYITMKKDDGGRKALKAGHWCIDWEINAQEGP